MGALDGLLNQVKSAISSHASTSNSDAGQLLSRITDLFDKHPHNQANHDVKPATEDAYGDPADAGSPRQNVKPASQDPYGDPANQKR